MQQNKGEIRRRNGTIVVKKPKWTDRNVVTDEHDGSMTLSVSNPDVPLPTGLHYDDNFLQRSSLGDEDIIDDLIHELDRLGWDWEGFEQRKRVQRYQLVDHVAQDIIDRQEEETQQQQRRRRRRFFQRQDVDDSDDQLAVMAPKSLEAIVERYQETSGNQPLFIVCEEYPYASMLYSDSSLVVTNFESTRPCQCHHDKIRRRDRVVESSTDDDPVVDDHDHDDISEEHSSSSHCRCFLAQLSIGSRHAIDHIHMPATREHSSFHLKSPNHWTDIRLDYGAVLTKTADCLWRWRSRIFRGFESDHFHHHHQQQQQNGNHHAPTARRRRNVQTTTMTTTNTASPIIVEGEGERCILLKFHNLPYSMSSGTSSLRESDIPKSFVCLPELLSSSDTQDGELKRQQQQQQQQPALLPSSTMKLGSLPMPPLQDLLTIIVTTSPIKSHPSTELLEKTFETFHHAGEAFAFRCRKVIVCDGCRIQDNGSTVVSRKHANTKQALRGGIATVEQAENYEEFKRRLRHLCREASSMSSSPFANAVVEELPSRHGYGFALGHALRTCVDTPYVCVIQHDRSFVRQTPIQETLEAMWQDPERIKYVGMSMRSNLMYRDIFLSKYGKRNHTTLGQLVLRPSILELDASIYGPGSKSAMSIQMKNEQATKSLHAFAEAYRAGNQCREQEMWVKDGHPPSSPDKHQLTLTPTVFWYDNTHLCHTAFYRDFIFHPAYKMVVRGGFVEEKVSPVIVKNAERLGLAAGHARFGSYLLDDHSGYFFTGHLDGGNYMTREQKEITMRQQKQKNQAQQQQLLQRGNNNNKQKK